MFEHADTKSCARVGARGDLRDPAGRARLLKRADVDVVLVVTGGTGVAAATSHANARAALHPQLPGFGELFFPRRVGRCNRRRRVAQSARPRTSPPASRPASGRPRGRARPRITVAARARPTPCGCSGVFNRTEGPADMSIQSPTGGSAGCARGTAMINRSRKSSCARRRFVQAVVVRLRRARRRRFKIFTNVKLDRARPEAHRSATGELRRRRLRIAPNSFALAYTVESASKVPRNVLCVCVGKTRTRAAASSRTSRRSSQWEGRRSRSRTRRRCPQSTRTKDSRRCCSSGRTSR